MNTSNNKLRMPLLLLGALVLVCIGFAVGGGVGFLIGRNSTNTSNDINISNQPGSTSISEPQNVLVGEWSEGDNSIEFFSDGTFSVNGKNRGTYAVSGNNNLKLDYKDADSVSSSFEVSENNLIVIFDVKGDTARHTYWKGKPEDGTPTDVAKTIIDAAIRSDFEAVRSFYTPDYRDQITSWKQVYGTCGIGVCQATTMAQCKGVDYQVLETRTQSAYSNMSIVFAAPCGIAFFDAQKHKIIRFNLKLVSNRWYLLGDYLALY